MSDGGRGGTGEANSRGEWRRKLGMLEWVVTKRGHLPFFGLCWGPSSQLYPGNHPAAMIYGRARLSDLGQITNDGSITLQKK